ncbi:MAG: SH3 domain-containing protein [Caldilineaceae bacterium]|nr:SH3 domain-containing protein [Caldilineaceae bacterium]
MKVNSLVVVLALFVTVVLVGGCTIPLPLPTGAMPQTGTMEPASTPEATSDPLAEEGGAMATVATRSLRVRQTPDENSEVVAGIAEGESYRVLALSDDGLWVQLAIDSAPDGNGWVSTNFVSVEGDITDLAAGEAAAGEAAMDEAAGTIPEVTLVPTPQSGFGIVNTDGVRLRVRSGPSTDDPIVGYIYDGESYQILETSADGLWVRIPASTGDNTDNTEGGWVAAEFLTIGE